MERGGAAHVLALSRCLAPEENDMTRKIAAALLASSIAFAPAPVLAKGCIRGAVAGGVAGHYAHHHAIAGAMAGCAAGHYYYKHKARVAAQQQTNARVH